MSNFLERLLVCCTVIAVIGLLLFFIDLLVVRALITLLVAGLSAVALWEMGQLAKAKGWSLPLPFLIGSGIVITASFSYLPQYVPLLFFVAVLGLLALHAKQISGALVESALSLFGLLYIAVPLGMILALLNLGEGRFWVIYLIAVTKSADIGGYVGGSLWGRRKLAPQISPSKTVEGFLVGMVASLAVSFLFSLFGALSPFQWIGLGLLLGVIGVFGDLVESLFKRDAGKKDSNRLPGIGGVLDLLDSLLFAIPVIYFYLTL